MNAVALRVAGEPLDDRGADHADQRPRGAETVVREEDRHAREQRTRSDRLRLGEPIVAERAAPTQRAVDPGLERLFSRILSAGSSFSS